METFTLKFSRSLSLLLYLMSLSIIKRDMRFLLTWASIKCHLIALFSALFHRAIVVYISLVTQFSKRESFDLFSKWQTVNALLSCFLMCLQEQMEKKVVKWKFSRKMLQNKRMVGMKIYFLSIAVIRFDAQHFLATYECLFFLCVKRRIIEVLRAFYENVKLWEWAQSKKNKK
jgi:hypothetical protein